MIDAHQQAWMIILIPVFLVYGFIELRRGWNIIKHGEKSHTIAIRLRIWIIKQFAGERQATQYQKSLEKNKDYMKRMGLYSLIGGILSLAICVMWIVVLSLNTR